MHRMSTEVSWKVENFRNKHPILSKKGLEWETLNLMVGFHNKHNFKEQGKIYGENRECQMNTISSDDICVGVNVCMHVVISTHMNVLMYICMYEHSGMKCEKRRLLTVWYTLRFHTPIFFWAKGRCW